MVIDIDQVASKDFMRRDTNQGWHVLPECQGFADQTDRFFSYRCAMSVARLLVLSLPFISVVHGAAVPPAASTDDELHHAVDWQVNNGCIQNYQIKRVNFVDNSTGIMELTGNRKVKVTLVNACSGIRQDGYVHKPVNNKFCEGDVLRVMRSGGVCVVDTLEPYVEPETDNSGDTTQK